jgi:hypothetical protein
VVSLVSCVPALPSSLAGVLPRESGLYGWWGSPSVLPEFGGTMHEGEPELRLLYVGLASTLRSRLVGNHMRRTGNSTLRQTLAGLLLDEHAFRPRMTDRVVLIEEDESRLTAWMTENLRVTWSTHPTPKDVEADVIRALRPPLNVDHATGPARDAVKAAKQRFRASAETTY